MTQWPTIYVASKTRHAPMWQSLRENHDIISTWIDKAGPGESGSMEDLWVRCIAESSSADYLIAYHEPGDEWKGAFIEFGSALSAGRTVHLVGGHQDWSFAHHPKVVRFDSLEDAFAAATAPHSWSDADIAMLDDIDKAVKRAADVISLVGVPSEEEDPEEWNAEFERVSHCGTCTVRAVLEVVWPSIDRYIESLRRRAS